MDILVLMLKFAISLIIFVILFFALALVITLVLTAVWWLFDTITYKWRK